MLVESVRAPTSIGLIGCGAWGRYILRDLVALNCIVWVVAISSVSVENAYANGAAHVKSDIDELPEHLDGYVIAVPTSVHAQVIEGLLKRGRPIFTEKPLTDSVAPAEALLEEAGERIFVMDKWRYHPAINALAKCVQSRELGMLRTLRANRLGWGQTHDDTDPIWVLLPHDLSIVLHLLGSLPEPNGSIVHGTTHDRITGLTASLGASPTILIQVSSRHPIHDRSVVLEFDDGIAAMLDPYGEHILIRRGKTLEDCRLTNPEKRPVSKEMPLYLELKAFVDYLHGGPPPLSPARDGVEIVKMIALLRQMAGLKD